MPRRARRGARARNRTADDSPTTDLVLRDATTSAPTDTSPIGRTSNALLNRYEILGAVNPSNASGFTQQIWLHDLTTDHTVLIADNATDYVGSRAGYLSWSTGSGRSAAWRMLDLQQLT